MTAVDTEAPALTLRQLRLDAKKTFAEIHAEMRRFDPSTPANTTSLMHMISSGTGQVDRLRAFAAVIGVPLEVVLKANDNTRRARPGGRSGKNP